MSPSRARKLSRWQRLATVAILSVSAGQALAQRPLNVTTGEMAMLPEYCPDTMGFKYGDQFSNTSPRAPHWVGLMGQSFWALHHYCWGLVKMRRAGAPGLPKELRHGELANAIGDFQYVVNNSTSRFVLLPEIFLKMGDAYVLLDNFGAAQEAYANARGQKSDYWPAYVRWAEVLLKIGKKQDALSHLEECLRINASEPALRAAYTRMGGHLDAFLRTLPPRMPQASASTAGS